MSRGLSFRPPVNTGHADAPGYNLERCSHAALRPARPLGGAAGDLDRLRAGGDRGGRLGGCLPGPLVEAEVRRRAAREVAGVSVELSEPDQALAALAEVRASIDELDHIAGRLARAATVHGGTWADVGSSLRLSAEAARRAYESPR